MDEPTEQDKLPYDEIEVSYASGPNSISGTLMVPKGRTRFPVVVFLSGSNRGERDQGRVFLADAEIASLQFDSPGFGKSTGNRNQSMDDRKRDALAAVSFLMTRQEINPQGIGLWGFSQGGWIVQMAASASENVAFGIMSSGPGVSGLEQLKYSHMNEYKLAQLDATSIEQANLLLDIILEGSLVRVSYGDPELLKKLRALHGSVLPGIDLSFMLQKVTQWPDKELWIALLLALKSGDQDKLIDGLDAAFQKWDSEGHAWLQSLYGKRFGLPCFSFSKLDSTFAIFDDCLRLTTPRFYLEKIKCPVLAYFGKNDTLCPVDKDVQIYRESLQKSGNPDFTLKIFPGGHCPFDKEIQSFVVNWILKRFKAC